MVRQRFLYVNIFLWLNCCCSLIHGKFNNATWSALLYHRRAITCHRYHNRRARFQIICPPNKCVRGKWNSKQWKLLSVSNSMCVYMSTESQQVRKFNRITSSLVSKLISTKMHTLVCSLPLSLSLFCSLSLVASPRETLTECQRCYDPFSHQLCDVTKSRAWFSLIKSKQKHFFPDTIWKLPREFIHELTTTTPKMKTRHKKTWPKMNENSLANVYLDGAYFTHFRNNIHHAHTSIIP